MTLLTVSNENVRPQDVIEPLWKTGVAKDGETMISFDVKKEFVGRYLVLFFFPMDFKVDSAEVLAFKANLEEFEKEQCSIVGVTSDGPLAIKRWIYKDASCGGFGGPVGFPILSDKDLSLSMSLGVARDCGTPARATFIVNQKGNVRYSKVHCSEIGRSVKEILRLVQAFRFSDLTGEALPSGWTPGGKVIPTSYTQKVKYYLETYKVAKEVDEKETEIREEIIDKINEQGMAKKEVRTEEEEKGDKIQVVAEEIPSEEEVKEVKEI